MRRLHGLPNTESVLSYLQYLPSLGLPSSIGLSMEICIIICSESLTFVVVCTMVCSFVVLVVAIAVKAVGFVKALVLTVGTLAAATVPAEGNGRATVVV